MVVALYNCFIFQQGALRLYAESVICAPEYGPELSLAYGNRYQIHVSKIRLKL